MIPRPFDDIDGEYLKEFIREKNPESRTLEYKEHGGPDWHHNRVLATICAFANQTDGDLIIGVKSEKGIPKKITGVDNTKVDKEKTRIENLLGENIEPRIRRYQIKEIKTSKTHSAILIRVRRSWIGPHRLTTTAEFYGRSLEDPKGGDNLKRRFHGRHSAGNYELPMNELRRMFTEGMELTDRIQNWVDARVKKINSAHGKFSRLSQDPKAILHLVPLSAFADHREVDVKAAFEDLKRRRLFFDSSGDSPTYNLEGVILRHEKRGSILSSFQLFRSGNIEAVIDLPSETKNNSGFDESIKRLAPPESRIMPVIDTYFASMKRLGIEPPVYAFVHVLFATGYRFFSDRNIELRSSDAVEDDIIVLPSIELARLEGDLKPKFKPVFDVGWQAFGLEKSAYFDEVGKFKDIQ